MRISNFYETLPLSLHVIDLIKYHRRQLNQSHQLDKDLYIPFCAIRRH